MKIMNKNVIILKNLRRELRTMKIILIFNLSEENGSFYTLKLHEFYQTNI